MFILRCIIVVENTIRVLNVTVKTLDSPKRLLRFFWATIKDIVFKNNVKVKHFDIAS